MSTNTANPCDIKNISVAYRERVVVKNVSFTVRPGEILAVLGPNGAGKSTVIKSSLQLIPKLHGDVSFFGQPLKKVRTRIGYMPQVAQVDWDFPATVNDVVKMGTYTRLGWIKRAGKAEQEAAAQALEDLGISDLADRHISELSGGQKQRTFVARALASQPDFLILDEPFAGVDIASEQAIRNTLRNWADGGKSVLIVHHDLNTVREFCDSVAILKDGEVASYGPIDTAFTPDIISHVYDLHLALGMDK